MKYFLLLLSVSAVAQASDWKEKARHMQEQYENVKAVCAAKHDLTEDELKAVEAMEQPVTRREKCVLECILTESGVMESGKFSRTGSDNIAEYLYDDDPDNLALAQDVSKRCEKAVEAAKLDDGCDTAAETFRCLRRVSKQLGVKAETDY